MTIKKVKVQLATLDTGSKFEFPEEPGTICKVISKTLSQVVWKKPDNCCGTSKPSEEVHPL